MKIERILQRCALSILVWLAVFGAAPAITKPVRIELLDGVIAPNTVGALGGLACRNVDHIVHLHLVIDWPSNAISVETTDFKRLIFSNDLAEYLFPDGTYNRSQGTFLISGYFIPRSGGMHQGVISIYFEKIDDVQALLKPNVREVRVNNQKC